MGKRHIDWRLAGYRMAWITLALSGIANLHTVRVMITDSTYMPGGLQLAATVAMLLALCRIGAFK